MTVDLSEWRKPLILKWIDIDSGGWGMESELEGGQPRELRTPGNWCAVMTANPGL